MSSNFRYQPFVSASGNLGGKVPVVDNVLSSNEQESYPTTSLDESCIEVEFQTDRNFYVDLSQTYLALKLKLVRGRGYEIYNRRETKKEHKEETKPEEEETAEEATVALVTHVNNIFHSIFSTLMCTSTISKFTTLMDCMCTNLAFPKTSKEPSLNTMESCTARDTTMKKSLMKLWKRLWLSFFSQGEWKCLADLMASCCMVNQVLAFFHLWIAISQYVI